MKKALLLLACTLLSAQAHAYDLPYIGDVQTIKATYDDTLSYLARDYNLGYVEIISANPDIDPWMPGEGTQITLPTRHIFPDAPHKGIVINLPEMRLYAFLDSELEPLTFPLGIGREGLETPTGETSIISKVAGPIWRPTARMREEDPTLPASIGPGADNPLGTHALYLGWPEYRIHGTNRPFGIGRRVSSGCIRMYPEAIKRMYTLIDAGTPVTVLDQPIKAAWIDGDFYIEAHTNMAQSIAVEEGNPMSPAPLTADEKAFIRRIAGDKADQLDWDKIESIVEKRIGMPMLALKTQTKADPATEATADKKEALPKAEEPPSQIETVQNAYSLND